MGIHYVIIDDLNPLLTGRSIGVANLFVGTDTAFAPTPYPVDFTTYATSGLPRRDFTVTADPHGITNSGNLFPLRRGRGAPILVRAMTDITSSAILRAHTGPSKLTIYVPENVYTLGTAFLFPVASLGRKADLLVGNPNSWDVFVTVLVDGVVSTVTTVFAERAQRIPLTTRAITVVQSDIRIILQLRIDYGDHVEMTMVTPLHEP